jgi:ElaB/YqjD/DUF883 family membrane-anchored ribosome-binding protein
MARKTLWQRVRDTVESVFAELGDASKIKRQKEQERADDGLRQTPTAQKKEPHGRRAPF